MKKIIITGGSGLIGQSLSSFLSKEGHQVSWLTRKEKSYKYPSYLWNPEKKEMDSSSLLDKDVLIQLAGSNIADGRWTLKKKKDIIESRIRAIQTLCIHLKKNRLHLSHIIQASGIGYYGDRGLEKINEKSSAGDQGFLLEVCKIWEAEAECLKEFTDHFTIIRTGLYLSPNGGVWPKIIQTKKFGFLVYFGDGNQMYSWIHYHDFNRAISFLLNKNLDGIINITSPNPESNKNLIIKINLQLNNKKLMVGLPSSILKLMLGELSQTVLSSSYVLPVVLMENGFQFQYEKLDEAVKDLLKTN